MKENWEIASHGYRWIEYQYFSKTEEREHFEKAIEIHKQITGSRPTGWYTGRTSPYSRKLTAEDGGFLYNADSYADDLPYWEKLPDCKAQLIVPYTLDSNDMRFATPQGFNSGEQFYSYLKDAFDYLYLELWEDFHHNLLNLYHRFHNLILVLNFRIINKNFL